MSEYTIPIDADLSLKFSSRGGTTSYRFIAQGLERPIDGDTQQRIDSWISGGLWLLQSSPLSEKLSCLAELGEILKGLGVEPGGKELVGILGAHNLLAHECAQQFAELSESLSIRDRNFWRFEYMTKLHGRLRPVTMWPMDQLLKRISDTLVLLGDDIADPLGKTVEEVFDLDNVLQSSRPIMAGQESNARFHVKNREQMTSHGLSDVSLDIVELDSHGEVQNSFPWQSAIESFSDSAKVARRVVIRMESSLALALTESINAWNNLVQFYDTEDCNALSDVFVAKYIGLLTRTLPNEPLRKMLASISKAPDLVPPFADFHLKCRFTYGSRGERKTVEAGFRLEVVDSLYAFVSLLPPFIEAPAIEVELVDVRLNRNLKLIREVVPQLNLPTFLQLKKVNEFTEFDRHLRRSLEEKILEMNGLLALGDILRAELVTSDVYVLRQALGQTFGKL